MFEEMWNIIDRDELLDLCFFNASLDWKGSFNLNVVQYKKVRAFLEKPSWLALYCLVFIVVKHVLCG